MAEKIKETKETTTEEKTGFFKKIGNGIASFCGKPAVKKTAKVVGFGSLAIATGLGALAGIDVLGRRGSKYIDVPTRRTTDNSDGVVPEDCFKDEESETTAE